VWVCGGVVLGEWLERGGAGASGQEESQRGKNLEGGLWGAYSELRKGPLKDGLNLNPAGNY